MVVVANMNRGHSYHVVLGGLSSASILFLLYLACLLPTGTFGIIALSGFIPLLVKILTSLSGGILCWLSSSLLGCFLLPQKLVPLLFMLCFGLYPIIQSLLSEHKPSGRILLKLLYANVSILLSLSLFKQILFPLFPPYFHHVSPILCTGNLCFFAYDYGLSQVIPNITKKLQWLLS